MEARCAKTKQTLCVGRHTKYLPSGSFLQDLALGPLFIPWTKVYTSFIPLHLHATKSPPIPSMKELITWKDCEEEKDNPAAAKALHVTTDHCNSTGSFHGGCQAISMEQLCHDINVESSHDDHLQLKSMSISYMTTGKDKVSFIQRPLQTSCKSHTSIVQVRGSNNVIVSEGILHYE